MKNGLYIFGTCSGTEPFPGRHHVAFAVAVHDRLYWFDAGECCSYTAHLMGVDVRHVRAIFISHPHMDHVGGLGSLFWNMRKLDGKERIMDGRTIDLFMPNRETWPAQLALLRQTEGNFEIHFAVQEHRIQDGALFEDENLRVTALHNTHMPLNADGECVSYSFSIEALGKRVVYSGDVGNYREIEPLLRNADILLAETGHHQPAQVCEALNEMGIRPQKLLFIHHGRALLNDGENAMKRAESVYAGEMKALEDGTFVSMDF